MGNLMDCCVPRSDGKYRKQLEECKAQKKKFTDKEFPPEKKSLIVDWNADDPDVHENKGEWNKIEWLRASEIPELNDNEGQLQVFANTIEPADIRQGGLGNCYFLSVLACTAERGYRIRRLFLSNTFSPEGIYALKLTKNGEPMVVVIDDHFPTKNQGTIFSSAHGNELWVLIMEKAWAKLHNCYHRIIGGQCHETFRDVTGAPAWEIMSKPEEGPDDIWDKIVEGEKKDYIMAAGVSSSSEEEGARLQEFGLVGGHAYSLLSAAIVKDKSGQKVKLVQVRNPWGSFEWKGDWGDNSDCWTEEAKRLVGLTTADDGAFWMEFEQFRQFFTRIQICKYLDSNNFASKKLKISQDGYHLVKMTIDTAGEHTVSVSQFDQRCAPLNSQHEYTNCKVIVVRAVQGKLEQGVVFIKGQKGFMDRDTYVELGEIGPGTYYVCVEMELATNENYERYGSQICVTNYGPGKTSFGGDDSNKYPVSQVLEAAFTHKIRKFPDQMKQSDMGGRGAEDIKIVEQKETPEGYRFIWVNNQNQQYAFEEEMTYKTFDGQQLLKPHIGPGEVANVLTITDMSYKFNVPPGDSKMVIIRCNVQGYGMSGSKKQGLTPYEPPPKPAPKK